eukprot:TRINITY_DN3055_c0_g1_i1.p1 TRINITY_DN3055_c0_g1~~TRINITY_DN3055_c0_g1_i1.p1  ORF type:complete len:391 (-),score=76.42 TRINITY_DN3055_c0_g1_i1:662-1834(-)
MHGMQKFAKSQQLPFNTSAISRRKTHAQRRHARANAVTFSTMPAHAPFLPAPSSPSTRSSRHESRLESRLLQQLLRERDAIAHLRASLPTLCALLTAEIARLRAASSSSPPSPSQTRRLKLRVPADQFPNYNFVGRLLGPRGTTLQTLQRRTGCRILIRGRGSIRRHRERDVRGKPGWQHVFHEPLHVVIEAPDELTEHDARGALARAAHAVRLLLVPVPEECDALKRNQLRALAAINASFRDDRHLTSGPLSSMGPSSSLPDLPSPFSFQPALGTPEELGASEDPLALHKLFGAHELCAFDELSAINERGAVNELIDTVPRTHVKVKASTALSAGGFIGGQFYNGAFSNGSERTSSCSPRSAWERSTSAPASLSLPASATASSSQALHY